MTDSIITLNLQESACPERLCLRRGDNGGILRICLRDGLRPPSLDAASAALTARLPEGGLVYQEGTLEDHEVILQVTGQLTSQAGEVPCEVRLFDDAGGLLTTGRFALEVADTLYHDGDDILPPAAPTRVLMAPADCREGQYFKISQVDENGTAVKVEATDSPGGGYYIPSFAGTDAGELEIAFAKSEDWMPDIPGAVVALPESTPGPQGEQGPAGADGEPGRDGLTPYIGENGNWWIGETDTGKPSRGEPGESAGSEGQAGANGATFTPSVDEEGNLSWTNDKGLENPAAVNIRGADGISPTITRWLHTAQSLSGGTIRKTYLTITNADGTAFDVLVYDSEDLPVRGEDYWTDADKAEMVEAVLAALPTWTGGSY